jgi:hypothetical protein
VSVDGHIGDCHQVLLMSTAQYYTIAGYNKTMLKMRKEKEKRRHRRNRRQPKLSKGSKLNNIWRLPAIPVASPTKIYFASIRKSMQP